MTRKAYDEQTELRVADLYRSGWTLRKIALELGGSERAVSNALRRQGVTTRTSADYQVWRGDPEQKAEVLRLYTEGCSIRYVARVLKCRTDRITETLEEAGVQLAPGGAGRWVFSYAQSLELAKEYDSGASLASLAKKHGSNTNTVSKSIRRVGQSIRMAGRRRFWTTEREAWVVGQYESGLSQADIASELGVDQHSVSAVLRRNGVAGRVGRSGPNHGSWKGGRLVVGGGYIWVRPSMEDMPYCRPNAGGYVAEHRLVMGRAFGRCLLPNETVHHINGDRGDNRIENLQLRQGQHGSGAAFACGDCGSHNVQPVPLATSIA